MSLRHTRMDVYIYVCIVKVCMYVCFCLCMLFMCEAWGGIEQYEGWPRGLWDRVPYIYFALSVASLCLFKSNPLLFASSLLLLLLFFAHHSYLGLGEQAKAVQVLMRRGGRSSRIAAMGVALACALTDEGIDNYARTHV